MDRYLYLDCSAGISGDMCVASLLDMGADSRLLMKAFADVDDEFEIAISDVDKHGIRACDFDVIIEGNHDHDMEYLNGGKHVHEHDHHHRNLSEVLEIIGNMDISENAKSLSEKIFRIVAEAESRVHGKPIEEIHFHEVGALDSIIDIVSFSVLYDSLGFAGAIVTGIADGHGTVMCQHGMIPVPVPAAAEIAAEYGLKIIDTDVNGELMTPTGAAIAAAIMKSDRLPHSYKIIRKGIGAGKRDYPTSGILRAFEIEPAGYDSDTIMKLETNIDDCSGECLGHTMDLLLEAGAKDVSFSPIFMKKNRPAYRMEILCSPDDCPLMEEIVFRNTTTIGIRRTVTERDILKRDSAAVGTPYGKADVKICMVGGEERFYPEYASASRIAREAKIGYREAYDLILDCMKKTL